MKKLETSRLVLRNFEEKDLDDLFEYARLDTVGPNAGWMPHPDREHSKKILNHFIEANDVFAIELKSENKVIGSVGLHKVDLLEKKGVYELGYVLSTFYEKQGIMTEAVNKVLKYAFTEYGLEEVYVGHFVENYRSQKLISRFPFKFLLEHDYESRDYGKKKSKMYILTKEDYINWEENR
jgi:RimJ/RimL family protein N-acetyltransferase